MTQTYSIQRTETKGGFTIIWTKEGTAVVYDLKGNANEVTREYCSCGREPCVHQRAAFELEAAPRPRSHQTSQEPRSAAQELQPYQNPSPRQINLSLAQALVLYPTTTALLWVAKGLLRFASK